MSDNLKQLLKKRKAEIRKIQADLRDELKQIKAAELAISNEAKSSTLKTSIINRRPPEPTIKEMIIAVLDLKFGSNHNGAHANEILKTIEMIFDKKIARSSLSPQLSRLKNEGILEFDNSLWSLAKYAPNNEAPIGASWSNDARTSFSYNHTGASQSQRGVLFRDERRHFHGN